MSDLLVIKNVTMLNKSITIIISAKENLEYTSRRMSELIHKMPTLLSRT